MIRKILLFLLFALIVIQFFRPKKNKAEGPFPNYIGNAYPVPAAVKPILEKACNDCHSNNTVYPWYNNIQPVAWWLDGHVKDGKKAFNLDEYLNRSPRFQYNQMKQTIDLVKKKDMPLESYTWIHKNAILTDAEKDSLFAYASSVTKSLEGKYPMDSLVRKKP